MATISQPVTVARSAQAAQHAPMDRHSDVGSYFLAGAFVVAAVGGGAYYMLEKNKSSTTPPPPSTGQLGITTTSLPPATVGTPYFALAQASGGVSPYTWSAAGLPAGLTMSSSGLITGTPTTAGSFAAAVTVTDSTSPTPLTATAIIPITVSAASTATGGCPSTNPAITLGLDPGTLLKAPTGPPTYQPTGLYVLDSKLVKHAVPSLTIASDCHYNLSGSCVVEISSEELYCIPTGASVTSSTCVPATSACTSAGGGPGRRPSAAVTGYRRRR